MPAQRRNYVYEPKKQLFGTVHFLKEYPHTLMSEHLSILATEGWEEELRSDLPNNCIFVAVKKGKDDFEVEESSKVGISSKSEHLITCSKCGEGIDPASYLWCLKQCKGIPTFLCRDCAPENARVCPHCGSKTGDRRDQR